MKKILLLLLIMFSATSVLAASPKPDYTVKMAIYKYKTENYTGCIQDLEKYLETKETALAHYYLAMSYAQAGKRDEALASYESAIDLADMEGNMYLKSYAMLGKKKIEKPEAFQDQNEFDDAYSVISRESAIPSALKKDLKEKRLEYLRNQINAGVKPKF